MWFNLKIHPSCLSGAKHVYKTIKLSTYLPENLKDLIDPIINQNLKIKKYGENQKCIWILRTKLNLDSKKFKIENE
jgi:hypothetical protein